MRLATITFNLSMAFNPGELKNIANIKKKNQKMNKNGIVVLARIWTMCKTCISTWHC